MPFRENNNLGFEPKGNEALTANISFKTTKRKKELLKNVPNWQERLRNCVDQLIKEHEQTNN
ncbi:MAG: hypothetical protein V7L31_20965 [Nostoc sp.]